MQSMAIVQAFIWQSCLDSVGLRNPAKIQGRTQNIMFLRPKNAKRHVYNSTVQT